MSTRTRSLTVTAELIRAYSRRGNYHSDAGTAAELGLPGLVAQGMQALGPAYGLLLDAWGADFLEHGELDVKFVGMVLADHTVSARVDVDDTAEAADAALEVTNDTTGKVAVVGTATRRA